MPFFGPLKLAEPDAPSTGAAPGQPGYTALPPGTQFRLGGQPPGQNYLDFVSQQLRNRLPGMSGLTSYPGSTPGSVGALGFTYNQPAESGTLEGIGAVTPESLTALLSGSGSPLTIEQLISRVPEARGASRFDLNPGSSTLQPGQTGQPRFQIAPGNPGFGQEIDWPTGGGGGVSGVGPGTGASAATMGDVSAVTNPAGALGITGPSFDTPLGSFNPVQGLANNMISGFNINGISPIGMTQAVQGIGSTLAGLTGVSPQMDPNIAHAMDISQQLGMAYGTNPTSGVAGVGALGMSAGPQGSVNFGTSPSALGSSTMGGATGISSTGVAFGGHGQAPNLNTAQAQAQNLSQNTMFSTNRGVDEPGITGGTGQDAGQAAADAATASATAGTGVSSSTGSEGVGPAGEGGGGAGGGGAGGTVICSVLHDCGYMDDSTWEADRQFGLKLPVHVYQGYLIWARPLARAMRKSSLLTHLIAQIAMPWARYMATGEGKLGKFIMRAGYKLCDYLGRNRRQVPSLSRIS